MRQFNRDLDIVRTMQQFRPQAENTGAEWAAALENFGNAYNKAQDKQKQQDLADALMGGDEKQILAARAAYDPSGTVNYLDQQQRQQQAREWALADAERNHQWDMDKLATMNNNALGLVKAKAMLENNQNQDARAKALADAETGIAQLQDVADSGRIGPWTRFAQKMNLADSDQQKDFGRVSSSVAAIAPLAIQNLKNAGVSGINTLDEFMTYVGLPANPTSEEIQGALPMISQILGVRTKSQTPISQLQAPASQNIGGFMVERE